MANLIIWNENDGGRTELDRRRCISLTSDCGTDELPYVLSASKAQLRSIMMTSSNGNIFRVTGPMCGEFTGPGEFPAQMPVTGSFDVFFDLRLHKRLSKQP